MGIKTYGELTLTDYFEVIKKRKGLIIKLTLLIIFFAIVFLLISPKTYESESIVQLANINGEIYSSAESVNLIRSLIILAPVINDFFTQDKKPSISSFNKNNLKVSVIMEQKTFSLITEISYIHIKTKAKKPEEAKEMNEAIIQRFFDYVKPEYEAKLVLLESQLQETKQSLEDVEKEIASLQNKQLDTEGISKVTLLKNLLFGYKLQKADLENKLSNKREYKVISEPEVPTSYSEPKIKFVLLEALVIGLLISIIWAFLKEKIMFQKKRI